MYYIGKWILLNQFLIAAVYYFSEKLKARHETVYIYILLFNGRICRVCIRLLATDCAMIFTILKHIDTCVLLSAFTQDLNKISNWCIGKP